MISKPPSPAKLKKLAQFILAGRLFVLTGAGISTESGIPDYRGPLSKTRKIEPIKHDEFLFNETKRQKYWARSFVGWPRVRDALPNRGHIVLTELEKRGLFSVIVTQNVDDLHYKAGSSTVVELHGNLNAVICMECGKKEKREHLQNRLYIANKGWTGHSMDIAPDGDVEIADKEINSFAVLGCEWCGGILKPDVVFFGDCVPKERVEKAWEHYSQSNSLLILGSSLSVFSGFRFVQQAFKDNKQVIIVNIGRTRGDGGAALKIEHTLSVVLAEVFHYLGTEERYIQ